MLGCSAAGPSSIRLLAKKFYEIKTHQMILVWPDVQIILANKKLVLVIGVSTDAD